MNDKKIEITRIFDAPIEKVWDAWTKAENLMQWKSPEGMTTPEAHVDLRVGGTYRVIMAGGHAGPNGKVIVGGTYKTIQKPNTLIFSWNWEGQDEETEITVLLKALSDTQTEMVFTHEGFVNKKSMKNHEHGWLSTFNKLEKFLK